MPTQDYNKLEAKNLGHLEVLEQINNNAYRLHLPLVVNTSDVFNIKYLTRFFATKPMLDTRTNLSHLGGLDAVPPQ